MIPKKASSLYQSLAEDKNLDPKLVESFVEFYYKNLRQAMATLSHTKLNVDGLGLFQIKPYKIKRAIATYSKTIDKYEENTFNDYHNKKRIEQKLVQLHDLQKLIDKDILEKETFKERKNEYIKTNLGRETQDNGGS